MPFYAAVSNLTRNRKPRPSRLRRRATARTLSTATTAAAVTATLTLASVLAGGCQARLDWIRLDAPHGFTVQVPADWDARVEDSGLIVFRSASGRDGGHLGGLIEPAVFVWPLYVGEAAGEEEPARADRLLGELWPFVFGDWPQGASRWLEGCGALVCSLGDAAPVKGLALLSITGECGLLSGWWAPPDAVSDWRAPCLKILQSFRFDPTLFRPDDVGAVPLITWTDPQEGAFSIKVPSGWACQGGVLRPYLDAAFSVQMTDGERLILFQQPRVPLYVCPSWVLDLAGFTQGTPYPTGPLTQPMVVWEYLPAMDYVRDLLVPDLAHSCGDLEVVSLQEVAVPDPRSPLIARVSGAAGSLTDGAGLSYGVLATTQLVTTPGNPGLWVAGVTLYRSQREDAATMARLVATVAASFRVDPAWAAREAQAVAERTCIIAQTGEDIAATISETFAYREAVQEHAAHEWSNAILGRTDVYDPDADQVWNVPAGSESYWRQSFEIWGSEGSSPPVPDPDFVELEELGK